MTSTAKRKFKIKITYFKSSGKMYVKGKFKMICTNCGQPGCPPICYMDDAVEHIKQLQQSGHSMPGVSGCWKGGPILVDCKKHGFPVLILPPKTEKKE